MAQQLSGEARHRERRRYRKPWRPVPAVGAAAGVIVVAVLVAGAPLDARSAGDAKAPAGPGSHGAADQGGPAGAHRDLDALEVRIAEVGEAWASLADYYRSEVAPIRRVLLRYRNDPALAERVAVALVREANQVGLEPRLLLAVLLVENPWLDPTIRSSVGAVGLMQVMPVHAGSWAGCEPDLEDIDANICHGARIFAHYFDASNGDIERALLRYNGCVRGTNTPDCHQYPYHVFARAGRASVLAWLGTGPAAGSR